MKEMILAPFRASGVSALASKICWEFFSVPQQLETLLEWRAARVTATICSGFFAALLFLLTCTESEYSCDLRHRNWFVTVSVFMSTTVVIVTCIADIVVLAILVKSLLLPLLCIFAALALLSYVIFVPACAPNPPRHVSPFSPPPASISTPTTSTTGWFPSLPWLQRCGLSWFVVNRHLSTCQSHVIHWLRCICSRCFSAFIPRVRARDGGHFTPRGGRMFCDDECVICTEPMRGHEVSARKSRQRYV